MKIEVPKVSKTLLIASSDVMSVLNRCREYEDSMNDASYRSISIITELELSQGLSDLKGLGFFENIKDLMLIIAIHSGYNSKRKYEVGYIPFSQFSKILMRYIKDIPTTLFSACCYSTEFQRFIYHLSPGSKVITTCSWRFPTSLSPKMCDYLKQREFREFIKEVIRQGIIFVSQDLFIIVTSKDLTGLITFINYNYEDLEAFYKQRNCIYASIQSQNANAPYRFSLPALSKYVYEVWIPRHSSGCILFAEDRAFVEKKITHDIDMIVQQAYIFIKIFKEDISTYNEKRIIKNNAFNLIRDNLSKLDYSIYDIKHFKNFTSKFMFEIDFKNIKASNWISPLPDEQNRQKEFILLAIDFLRKDR